ncbi:ribulose-phosphate 3-epimerase [Dysgonomonas sp. 521]|uniref:ribulose-phosphate 3-epimerase n=1 Tax=Dysgonomonas sp. 521 TaxID=2302932 RepID=UPI0013D62D5A|nr:ribulose-phosphate 3-epimerase [Dysgonomonas sp. 521]NDV93320.1 ribulose-phosphate 3-epimerase [Dysgonomonas sp. 521]
MQHKVAPSLLSADFLNLQADIEMVNNSEADWFHCDVMDGTFVPNISFGFPIIKQISKIAKKPLDVHLMIVNPDQYIPVVKDAGAYMMNVHYEACVHLHRTISAIHEAGMKAAVTLNPHTPVHLLDDILQDLDMVLLMSVNPGFGGQKFIERTLDKVACLKDMIVRRGLHTLIEVDGGVNLETGKRLVEAGADVLVAGNAVFADANPTAMIHKLKNLE